MAAESSLPFRRMPTWRHMMSRISPRAAVEGSELVLAAAGRDPCDVWAEFELAAGLGAGDPGSVSGLCLRPGASLIMASPARAPKTIPSRSELLARRLAPCAPVAAVSPAA